MAPAPRAALLLALLAAARGLQGSRQQPQQQPGEGGGAPKLRLQLPGAKAAARAGLRELPEPPEDARPSGGGAAAENLRATLDRWLEG